MDLEHGLIKVPWENINKVFRNSQKLIEKELTQVATAAADLEKKKDKLSKEEAYTSLDKLVGKLQGLKRKLEDTIKTEDEHIQKCKARIDHLSTFVDLDLSKTNEEQQRRWYKMKLDRLLADQFLREGYYESAQVLTKESQLEDLVDLNVFLASKKVIDSLKKGECKEALKWCIENKSKLKKINSTLEFNLHIQELIELIRVKKYNEAIAYSRKFLAPSANTNMKEIQRAMACMAFGPDTACNPYKSMFAKQRWTELIQQFKRDNYAIHSLPLDPPLFANLEIGLASLKTNQCYEDENFNINCPTCTANFRKISGQQMNDDNPPMVLPNGYAYSKNALLEMALKNDGKVTCPRTGNTYKFEELKKAFIS